MKNTLHKNTLILVVRISDYETKIQTIDKRLTKLENKTSVIESRIETISDTRKDINELIGTIRELTVLIQEQGKDTDKHDEDIELMKKQIVELQSSQIAVRNFILLIVPILAILITIVEFLHK